MKHVATPQFNTLALPLINAYVDFYQSRLDSKTYWVTAYNAGLALAEAHWPNTYRQKPGEKLKDFNERFEKQAESIPLAHRRQFRERLVSLLHNNIETDDEGQFVKGDAETRKLAGAKSKSDKVDRQFATINKDVSKLMNQLGIPCRDESTSREKRPQTVAALALAKSLLAEPQWLRSLVKESGIEMPKDNKEWVSLLRATANQVEAAAH